MLLSRHRRGTRRIAIKDVRTAFLQSDKFTPDVIKYIVFKNPITCELEYSRQTGPVYGEAGAPKRWENTLAPWLVQEGFERGCNEPAVFYHATRDVLLVTFVDDIMYDAEEDDIKWAADSINMRFECKELEWLEPDMVPIDYLGMELRLNTSRLHLCMVSYILQSISILQLDDICQNFESPRTPLSGPIDPDSPLLPDDLRKLFMTGTGCLGWLVETGRPDVCQSHSRISQYQAKPTVAAWEALKHIFLAERRVRIVTCSQYPGWRISA